ncbi:MAG: ATP synthase F1 subunit epsilon [Flavobacteriales bacterium TMED113]|nr:MAG: ATP synthase F1 subunit epsilon [Flavobacteriales bacterium TMED113]|tara:strand:- start:247 stop:483 length:237 start_codon:yes stop_codon:yes gene_type:complete
MKLEILTPEKKLFSGEVSSVQVPGSSGKFQMLNMHAPIVSSLDMGQIKITNLEKKEFLIDIKSGVVEMKNNEIIILAE